MLPASVGSSSVPGSSKDSGILERAVVGGITTSDAASASVDLFSIVSSESTSSMVCNSQRIDNHNFDGFWCGERLG
jgi:hypothetical protein